MISCIFDECRYPACDRTCGLDEPGIIAMLQEQISILDTYRRNMNLGLLEIRHLEERLDNLQREGYKDIFNKYEKCSFEECLFHPVSQKNRHPITWKNNGFPTQCYYHKNYPNEPTLGNWNCRYYDD